jgi:hypothetical protein
LFCLLHAVVEELLTIETLKSAEHTTPSFTHHHHMPHHVGRDADGLLETPLSVLFLVLGQEPVALFQFGQS